MTPAHLMCDIISPNVERRTESARYRRPAADSHRNVSRSGDQRFPGLFTIFDCQVPGQLKSVLDAAGFTEDGVRAALGHQSDRLQLKRIDLPLYERKLEACTALNTFIKLFMMQLWVKEDQVSEALAPLSVDELVTLGLLEKSDQGVHSRAALAICNGLILAHDRVAHDEEEPAIDHVLGVNASAFTLANLTVRRHARWALDIGAGSGIQALFLSRHSEHVVATDTNPRALNFLDFNARLNGIENIECRLGSLFEPVEGCRFDLITCNPPYVISPDSQYIFRDSGLPGDRICEQVVRQAPGYLEDAGYACILCNWAHRGDEHWSAPVRRWVANSTCDTWVLRGGTEDPLSYAAPWTRNTDRTGYATALDRWRSYYAESGIEALTIGAVILRQSRATGYRPWFRGDDWPGKPIDSCSDQVLRIFAAEDQLKASSEAALLEQRFSLVPEHSLRQESKFQNGEWVCQTCQLDLDRGLRFQFNLDNHTVRLLSHCDGAHTLTEAIAELSRKTGASVDQIRSRAVEILRRLLAYGFVITTVPGQSSASVRRVAGVGADAETGHGGAIIEQRQ